MTNLELGNMISELFERLRKEETASALLSQKVQKLSDELHNHTREEMVKYDSIEHKIARFEKLMWVVMGVLIAQTEPVSHILTAIFKVG